jgi:hypothetical protein
MIRQDLTFQVVDWVDVFTRKIYRDIVLESFGYCRKNKRLQLTPKRDKLWAYVTMSNHVHCIISADNGNLPDNNVSRSSKGTSCKLAPAGENKTL